MDPSKQTHQFFQCRSFQLPTRQHFRPFSLDVWDPFKDFPFPSSSSLSTFPEFSRENSAFLNTRIDWKETPEAPLVQGRPSGMKKEEVKVEVEDNRVLQISGERNVEKEDKNDKWHRVERSSGKFLRRFQLPENAKLDEIKAAMENGVLSVTVPKAEVKKADLPTRQHFRPFSLDLWDSLKDFPFPSSSSLSTFPEFSLEKSNFLNTRIDWKETPEAHVFKADLPGLKKEEVKVEVADDRVLQISGERNIEKEDKNDKWHRVERSSGKFLRRFQLPENAKVDEIKAAMENGVLSVTVPKAEVKKPDVKAIEIS
ncbi:HSP20-like chaperones superfamily protein, partial [Prunus dulcis]